MTNGNRFPNENMLMFQSLFWWILYYDEKKFTITGIVEGFNPCFGGSYIMTGQTYRICVPILYVSILVLVDLIL